MRTGSSLPDGRTTVGLERYRAFGRTLGSSAGSLPRGPSRPGTASCAAVLSALALGSPLRAPPTVVHPAGRAGPAGLRAGPRGSSSRRASSRRASSRPVACGGGVTLAGASPLLSAGPLISDPGGSGGGGGWCGGGGCGGWCGGGWCSGGGPRSYRARSRSCGGGGPVWGGVWGDGPPPRSWRAACGGGGAPRPCAPRSPPRPPPRPRSWARGRPRS